MPRSRRAARAGRRADTARAAPPARACLARWRRRCHRQLVAQRLDLASIQVGGHPARHQAARRVISGVTLGLPSRSPPIHEPKRIGAASSGRPRPWRARSARSIAARNAAPRPRGSARRPPGRPDFVERRRPFARTSSVCHDRRSRGAAALRSSSRPAASGPAGRAGERVGDAALLLQQRAAHDLGRMRRDHQLDAQTAMRRAARRRTPARAAAAALLDRRLLRTAARLALVLAPPPNAVVLFGDVGEIEELREARATGSAASTGIARSSVASASKSSPRPLRVRLASARTRSTRSKSGSPSSRRSVSPSSSPSSRTSSRSGLCGSIGHRLHRAVTVSANRSTMNGSQSCRTLTLISAVVGAEGHLIDSQILNAIFDKVIERGGAFEVLNFAIGRTNDEFSRISLKVSAPTGGAAPTLLEDLMPARLPSRRRRGRARADRRSGRLRAGRLLLDDQPADARARGGAGSRSSASGWTPSSSSTAAAPRAASCARSAPAIASSAAWTASASSRSSASATARLRVHDQRDLVERRVEASVAASPR